MTGWDDYLTRVDTYGRLALMLDLPDIRTVAEELIDSVRALELPDSVIRYDAQFGALEANLPGYETRMRNWRYALRVAETMSAARLGAGSVCNVVDLESRRRQRG